jgi:hypothetical protein
MITWFRFPGIILLALLALLCLAGTQHFKVRLADLKALYRQPAVYLRGDELSRVAGSEPSASEMQAMLLADRLACEPNLRAPEGRWPGRETGKAPLIVVCTSGGGVRAATWTAALLGRLDELAGFRRNAWLITGASGGMVGAAAWVASHHARRKTTEARPVDAAKLADAMAADSLTPAAQALVLHDVPSTLLPFALPHDRGAAVQAAWVRNLARIGVHLDVALADLRQGEATAEYPSLVFSPMIVEDGRRLLLSNLSLQAAVTNQVQWLGAGGAVSDGVASRAARHARDLFGPAFDRISLATAARLSASFPYVSPASHLPTTPERRVVDAGYYDNYGVDLATSWLERCLETNVAWMKEHVSGVLLIQIRDSELSLEAGGDLPDGLPEREPEKAPSNLARALQGLTSPPSAVLAARNSAMLFRNDAQLHTLGALLRTSLGDEVFATTIFELKGHLSLSWELSREEQDLLRAQVGSPGITEKVRNVGAWIAARGGA